MTGACRRAGEQRPLLLRSSPQDVAITICDSDVDQRTYEQQQHAYVDIERVSTTATTVLRYTSFRNTTMAATATAPSLAAVSPTFVYAQQQQQMALLARKYAAYTADDVVGQKRSRSKVVAAATTGYGSMPLQPVLDSDDDDDNNNRMSNGQRPTAASLRALLCKLDDPRSSKRHATQQPESLRADSTAAMTQSNQSETESDSDTSCGSNTASSSSTSSSSSLQSILRIRDGIYACRKVKKHVSVEFQLEETDDRDDDRAAREAAKRRYGALACASSCMPRRLTMEEKAELYRIRPDLQLTPMPLILREIEEIRRRRQRKLMFSILGGTLILLMIVVFYYLLTETQ